MPAFIEVFYAPGKVFESLKDRRGAWIAPLILSMLLLAGITALTIHFIGMETLARVQLERTRLSPEQMQIAMQRAASPAQMYISLTGAAFGAGLIILVVAGLLTVFGMISSRPPRFSTMFSMVVLAYFPYYVVVGVMTALVLVASPDPSTLNVSNLLATNTGAFLNPDTTSRWLYSVATSIDAISFAEIGLLSYGFSKITRSGFSAGLFSVGSLWIVYVFAKAVLTSLF